MEALCYPNQTQRWGKTGSLVGSFCLTLFLFFPLFLFVAFSFFFSFFIPFVLLLYAFLTSLLRLLSASLLSHPCFFVTHWLPVTSLQAESLCLCLVERTNQGPFWVTDTSWVSTSSTGLRFACCYNFKPRFLMLHAQVYYHITQGPYAYKPPHIRYVRYILKESFSRFQEYKYGART